MPQEPFINFWVAQNRQFPKTLVSIILMSSAMRGMIFVLVMGKAAYNWSSGLDPLFKLSKTEMLDKKTKKSIEAKMKNLVAAVSEVEKYSGLKYPPYYVEPVLTVTESTDNMGGLGVLYARTIPIDVNGRIEILVEVTAPLLLYATKVTLRLVLAHEFLHYVELVRNFTKLDVVSQITASSMYEERFTDSSRAVDPSRIYSNKKLVSDLRKRTSAGLDDEKLNEKCKTKWIERGLPMAKIPLGSNQVRVSIESIVRSTFDPKVKSLVASLT
ncbi:MAG: hypothetical protein ABSE82_14170 [Nitrososphaerales archaeon]